MASGLRAWDSTTFKAEARSSAALLGRSSVDNAARKDSEVSSKYGVPGPVFFLVAQTAPAGINDSRAPSLNPTPPRAVRSQPLPESSTFSVHTQPRAPATAAGRTTTNSPRRAH